jgi:hypothetical protein
MDYVEWIENKENMVEMIVNNYQKRWLLKLWNWKRQQSKI